MSALPNTTARSGATAPDCAREPASIRSGQRRFRRSRARPTGRPASRTAGLVAGPAFRDFPQSQQQDRQPQRNIDEEHPSPRTVLDEPSAQHGTDRRGDRREARPRPDRAAALLLGKISADQSQAAGDKQRPADSLEAPGNNQLPDVGRAVRTRPRQRRRARHRQRRSCGGRTGPPKTRR